VERDLQWEDLSLLCGPHWQVFGRIQLRTSAVVNAASNKRWRGP
jgi:hypothetical protein